MKFMPECQFKDIGLKKNDFITLTNSMADIDFTIGLREVICPALVICGEKDNVNKKAAFPGTRLILIIHRDWLKLNHILYPESVKLNVCHSTKSLYF